MKRHVYYLKRYILNQPRLTCIIFSFGMSADSPLHLTKDTFRQMLNLPQFKNLKHFEISYANESINVKDFCSFMKVSFYSKFT